MKDLQTNLFLHDFAPERQVDQNLLVGEKSSKFNRASEAQKLSAENEKKMQAAKDYIEGFRAKSRTEYVEKRDEKVSEQVAKERLRHENNIKAPRPDWAPVPTMPTDEKLKSDAEQAIDRQAETRLSYLDNLERHWQLAFYAHALGHAMEPPGHDHGDDIGR